MALFYPDILEHNNPANPLMDDGQLWGSLQIVADLTARDALPIAKRKIGMVVVWYVNSMPILKKYIGPNVTDPQWISAINWVSLSYPFFNYDLTEILLANAITTFVVGDKNDYATYILYYQMVRDSVIAVGQIEIMQNGTSIESPTYFTFREFGGLLGLVDITTAINGNNIEVSIGIDNSSVTDVTMNYNLIRKPFYYSQGQKVWSLQTSPVLSKALNGVIFFDANNGWAVGQDVSNHTLILNTVDGGANWTQQTSPIAGYSLNSVYFVSVNIGWAVGQTSVGVPNNIILVTTDGGANWTQQTSPVTGRLYSVFFLDANNGWISGEDGLGNFLLLNTTDGGVNWVAQAIPVASGGLYSVFFMDVNTGWSVGVNSGGQIVIFNTVDGGANWTQQTLVTIGYLLSVHFVDTDNGWAVGHKSSGEILIYYTIDGGANWVQQTSPVVNGTLWGVKFINANVGWAVGYDSSNTVVILNTVDGGANWIQQTSPIASGNLYGLSFLDANTGWAVGKSGSNILIMKYGYII
jgi:photosystem II stability/assembly factor-like uncharacterized protein